MTIEDRKAGYWKVTPDFAKDKPAFDLFVKAKALELSNNDPNWKDKTEVLAALDGDDFVMNMITVRLVYTP